ncbi:hypothetical protein LguiA_017281 [Lonicera macranthoides]
MKSKTSKELENFNPNFTSPNSKASNSPAIKSTAKSQKSAAKNPKPITSPSPRNKIRERKFVVARKKMNREKVSSSKLECKCKFSGKSNNCLCVAYESLRASQEEFFKSRLETDDQYELEKLNKLDKEVNDPKIENCCEGELGDNYCSEINEMQEEFFKNRGEIDDQCGLEKLNKTLDRAENKVGEEEMKNPKIDHCCEGKLGEKDCLETNEIICSSVKRRREKLLEEARESVPEPGFGRVMYLVKAFESLLSIPKSTESDKIDEKHSEDEKKIMKWALPGLQPRVSEAQVSSSSFCPSDFFLTSESLGLDSHISSSLDHGRTSGGGRRSRRNSTESTGTFGGIHRKRRQHKITSQKPFKLRTEQRGRSKEEEFIKKVQQMMTEEEKQRIPIAQGLPWTTDEPECLVKPPVKESTKPIDLVLHSNVRAVERAEFDHQHILSFEVYDHWGYVVNLNSSWASYCAYVAEKMSLIEQYRMEMERQRKLDEEEEIRRLRKELVPRAQPMPYFDRPFIPRRSEKHPTIPKEPRFHLPQHKKIKCYVSWNDLYTHQQ